MDLPVCPVQFQPGEPTDATNRSEGRDLEAGGTEALAQHRRPAGVADKLLSLGTWKNGRRRAEIDREINLLISSHPYRIWPDAGIHVWSGMTRRRKDRIQTHWSYGKNTS